MSTPPAPVLEVDGLSVTFNTPTGALRPVRNVSLSVNAGETLCIIGESGSGKSLTALATLGIQPPRARVEARRIAIAGTECPSDDPAAVASLRGREVAMIFQEPRTALNPVLRVGDALTEVYRHHTGASAVAARGRAVGMLQRVGITEPEQRLQQYPHQLSGGMRQRVMIAMALMCGPKLIIADEPTTALDVTIQAQVLLLLKKLQREMNLGLILITHDIGVVSVIAHRVAVMYAGEIVEQGALAEILASPRHPYTRALIDIASGERNSRDGTLASIRGTVGPPRLQRQGCSFAPRCNYADDECRSRAIALTGGTHAVRCVRPLGSGA